MRQSTRKGKVNRETGSGAVEGWCGTKGHGSGACVDRRRDARCRKKDSRSRQQQEGETGRHGGGRIGGLALFWTGGGRET